MDRVFFCNSGTEAIEGALKLARVAARKRGATERTRILALERSFHGRTFGALSVTHPVKYREPFEPLVPGVEFVRMNDVADLEAKFDDSVCAIVVEAIQGEGGIFPMSGQFWTRARELASHYGAALDRRRNPVRSGPHGAAVSPTSGTSACRTSWSSPSRSPEGCRWARSWRRRASPRRFHPGLHGSTFGGGPLTCAVALEFLAILEDEDLLENVRARGAQLRAGLSRLGAQFDFVREVRGEGLILGLDLTVEGRPYVEAALRHGLIINCTHDHVIRLLPPFIVSERQVEDCLARLRTVFEETKRPARCGPHVERGGFSAGAGCFEIASREIRETMTTIPVPLALSTDLLTGAEWGPTRVRELYQLAADVKAHPERYRTALDGRFLALILEKPSLRTRVTFRSGHAQHGRRGDVSGSHGVAARGARVDSRRGAEPVALGAGHRGARFRAAGAGAAGAIREHSGHQRAFRPFPSLPGVCGFLHAGGALRQLRGFKLAYVGDGNNVCHSLLMIGARVGAEVRVATPAGYEPQAEIVERGAAHRARPPAARSNCFVAPEEAVAGAQAVYTDVWASMGQENETAARAKIFAPYQVNAELLRHAAPDAVFLHCLPAHRGCEVTDEVMDSPRSIVFDQAENRLHVQKAILLMLLS